MDLENYIAKAKKYKPLSVAEEAEANVSKLVESHLMVAVKVAYKYKHFNVCIDDLIQAANIGLLKAAEKFNPEKGRFSTIAYMYCVSECCELLMRNTGAVSIGTSSKNKKIFLNAEGKTSEQLADDNNETVDYVNFIGSLKYGIQYDSSDDSLHKTTEYIDAFTNDSVISKVKSLLPKLNEVEQVVVTKRYLEDNDLTLNDIGSEFGVSGKRIFQVEKNAIKKLRGMVQ